MDINTEKCLIISNIVTPNNDLALLFTQHFGIIKKTWIIMPKMVEKGVRGSAGLGYGPRAIAG